MLAARQAQRLGLFAHAARQSAMAALQQQPRHYQRLASHGQYDADAWASPAPRPTSATQHLAASIQDCMARGDLVPDAIVQQILDARLSLPDAAARGYVLDGYPRSAAQAEALLASSSPPEVVVELAVDAETALTRIAARRGARGGGGARADDAVPSAVAQRFAQYDAERDAVVAVLRRRARVEVVAAGASRGVEAVAAEVAARVGASRRVVLTGRAGCGKSVMGRALMRRDGGAGGPVHVSTGELLRELTRPRSALGPGAVPLDGSGMGI